MPTKIIASTEAQNNFGRVLDDIVQNSTRYIVKRRSAPQVIILSLSDFGALFTSEAEQNKIKRVLREVSPGYSLGKFLD